MATITAVIVEADGTARKAKIENSVGGFQAVVGGYFRPLFHTEFTVYVNEDGYALRLPTNERIGEVIDYPYPLVGAALIVGPADEEGTDTDVPARIIEHYGLEK
jgi:hypothetical protein